MRRCQLCPLKQATRRGGGATDDGILVGGRIRVTQVEGIRHAINAERLVGAIITLTYIVCKDCGR